MVNLASSRGCNQAGEPNPKHRDAMWRLALVATAMAIVLAPLSVALAGRDRPEKRMAFQSTPVKARHDLKSEVKVKGEKREEEPEETDNAASGSASLSFSATGDSRSPHSTRQLFKHNNP